MDRPGECGGFYAKFLGGYTKIEVALEFSLLRVRIKFTTRAYMKNIPTCARLRGDGLGCGLVSKNLEGFSEK